MKSVYRIIFMILLMGVVIPAQARWIPQTSVDPNPVSSQCLMTDSNHVSLRVHIPGLQTSEKNEGTVTYQSVSLPGSGLQRQPGEPQLPVIRRFIAVPKEAVCKITSIEPVNPKIISSVTVWPAQPDFYRGATRPPFQLNPTAYAQPGPLPSRLAIIANDGVMRDLRLIQIDISPVQYSPEKKQLTVFDSVEVTIEVQGGLPFPETVSSSFFDLYQQVVLNFASLGIERDTNPESMLIIADDDFLPDLESFTQWKQQRGIQPVMVPMSDVGSTSAAIQNYIQDAYSNWEEPPVYVLLAGDGGQIPPLKGIYSCDSDYLFTLTDGTDIIPDIFISRLSAQNQGELAPQLDKIIRYEMLPAEGIWFNRIIGISSSDDGPMGINDDERLDGIAERWRVRNTSVSPINLYYSNGQGTTANITSNVNAGAFWVAYLGHGSGSSWSSPYFSSGHVDQLENGYFTPFVMDVSCSNGDFVGMSSCYAEHWMKGGTSGDPLGAVAMYSSTSDTSWDPSAILGQGVCFSVCGDPEGTFGGTAARMGEMTSLGMMYVIQELGTGSSTKEVLQQYVLFGDASAYIRSRSAYQPIVQHSESIPLAPGEFTVLVRNGELPVAGAVVSCKKIDDFHLIGVTGSDGSCSFNLSPESIGEVMLTVSGPDLIPYEALVQVYPSDCGILEWDQSMYNCDSSAMISLFDSNLNTDPLTTDHAVISIMSDSMALPSNVTLTETGPSTSIFTSEIELSSTDPFPVNHGDHLQAHYQDLECFLGITDVYADAIIDCQEPVISNISITVTAYDTITVTFTTDEDSEGSVAYGIETPPGSFQMEGVSGIDHQLIISGLSEGTDYYLEIRAMDSSGNLGKDDNSGNFYVAQTWARFMYVQEMMNEQPDWTFSGKWEFGEPEGNQGDPVSGHTGEFVAGYNLSGNYEPNLPATSLTTQAFDCSAAAQVQLTFWEWLGVEESIYDHAGIEISSDNGETWSVLWEHNGGTMEPDSWEFRQFDITSYCLGKNAVMIRWRMGPTDSYLNFCGWNIDDVEIWGTSSAIPSPSPTPVPATETPTPVPTETPTHTPVPTTIPYQHGMTLQLSDTLFEAGDWFQLDLFLKNSQPEKYDAAVIILLNIGQLYYSWPAWTNINDNLGYKLFEISGLSLTQASILAFQWPENAGQSEFPLYFYGALFETETGQMMGDVEILPWTYQ